MALRALLASAVSFFFRVDKGSLADKSGATGQRKGAERQRGAGAFFFFFFGERPFHCLLLP